MKYTHEQKLHLQDKILNCLMVPSALLQGMAGKEIYSPILTLDYIRVGLAQIDEIKQFLTKLEEK